MNCVCDHVVKLSDASFNVLLGEVHSTYVDQVFGAKCESDFNTVGMYSLSVKLSFTISLVFVYCTDPWYTM